MKNVILFLSLSLGCIANICAQELDQYRYVQVPEKFEFLNEINQYQLNALTAFLFEKYGFDVLYKKEVPGEVELCEVLQANVEKKTSILRSRVFVTLKDCNGNVVFNSKVGSSKEKDYKRSYHEALREAFTSFKGLRNDPKVIIDPVPDVVKEKASLPAEVVVDPTPPPGESKQLDTPEVMIDPVITSEELNDIQEASAGQSSTKSSEVLFFQNGGQDYMLQKTASGYELFHKNGEEKLGSLIQSSGGDHYIYSSKMVSGTAFFDTRENLVVEYLDPNTQQVISIIYRLKD